MKISPHKDGYISIKEEEMMCTTIELYEFSVED
jgi:hypothetical protein